MACGRETAHVGADLGDDHLRGQFTHARDGAQQADRLAEVDRGLGKLQVITSHKYPIFTVWCLFIKVVGQLRRNQVIYPRPKAIVRLYDDTFCVL